MSQALHHIGKLISIPSVSGNEEAIQKYISDCLSAVDYKPISIEGNLLVCIKGVRSDRALIFNAHVDTVSPGEASLWQTSPFKPRFEKDLVYGLGASDNKASVASLILLAEILRSNKPACDIWFMLVVKEEVDGSGTLKSLAWLKKHILQNYKKIEAVVMEPTDCRVVQIGHKGNLFLKIETCGESGHASKPELINSFAIGNLVKALEVVKKMSLKWEREYKDPILGMPTVSVTSIKAGDENIPNKFPSVASAALDIRTNRLMHGKTLSLIKKKLGKIAQVKLLYPPAPYGFTSPEATIAKAACKVLCSKIEVSPASSDLCFFTESGICGIIYGPGIKSQMHLPNEHCKLSNIEKCVWQFKELIDSWSKMEV